MTGLFTQPNALAACILLALVFYAVLGGADFGGGVWDLLARGPRRAEQRALIAHAIAPIWEANHVWLVLVIVLLFTCFPPAFAALSIALHIPLALMLIGIVLRGSAFVFRAYGSENDAAERRWGMVFASASVVTPVLLGMCVGAIASGAVGAARSEAGIYTRFVGTWLAPFPVACGALTLAAFSYLAAVYLTVDATRAGSRVLQDDFRSRALWAAGAVFATAVTALVTAGWGARSILIALTGSAWAAALHLSTAAAAVIALWALWTRRWRLARIAAPAQIALIIVGWGAAQYPNIIPGELTISDAAAPPITLFLTLLGLAGGTAILAPSLWYLFRVFKGHRGEPSATPAHPGDI